MHFINKVHNAYSDSIYIGDSVYRSVSSETNELAFGLAMDTDGESERGGENER